MTKAKHVFSVGVEEEYQLVDPQTWNLRPDCKRVMRNVRGRPDANIQYELHLNQIEMASRVCQTLDEVRNTVTDCRAALIDAAATVGSKLAASGTNPFPLPENSAITPKQRYRAMTNQYQQIARDLFIFGCHVHVEIADKATGLEVMNRSRRWLPLLQALTANSPYWDGHDTGYASFRRELWAQWPLAGPPPHFESVDQYDLCIRSLIGAGAIQDETFVYWDIRLPTKVPTIEFRGADVMSRVEETVGYTGMVRALVMQCVVDMHAGISSSPHVIPSVLSYAMWHAARYGVSASIVDPFECKTVSINELADNFLEYVRPSLEMSGDGEIVSRFVNDTVLNGGGAERQRRVAGESIDFIAVVQHVVDETAK